MQPRKMTCMQDSLYLKVNPVSLRNLLDVFPHVFFRCDGDQKCMVGFKLPYWPKVAWTLFRAMLHNPALYPEPDVFKPEWFLNADGSLQDDPVLTIAFRFGKRICPKRHFVNVTLFIMVTSLFSVFNIERGECGWGELSDYRFTGALVR
jgi:hypothetical protein